MTDEEWDRWHVPFQLFRWVTTYIGLMLLVQLALHVAEARLDGWWLVAPSAGCWCLAASRVERKS